MKDGTLTVLYTKATREYAQHVRYWRDVRESLVSLFSCLAYEPRDPCMHDVWEWQGQMPFFFLIILHSSYKL
jgi:hypothetical protein